MDVITEDAMRSHSNLNSSHTGENTDSAVGDFLPWGKHAGAHFVKESLLSDGIRRFVHAMLVYE